MNNLSESSIVDLKAELYRKEAEITEKHRDGDSSLLEHKKSKTLKNIALINDQIRQIPRKIKQSVDKKTNENIPFLPLMTEEELKKLNESKRVLEAKAILYDKLKSNAEEGNYTNNPENSILVDFSRKAELEGSLPSRSSNLLKRTESDDEINPKLSFHEVVYKTEQEHRDRMKAKWEAERERLRNNPDVGEHYQNILFDELREHGVGYYHFSTDQKERDTQITLLNQLRSQTLTARESNKRTKVARDEKMKERLIKIQKRRGIEPSEDLSTIIEETPPIASVSQPSQNTNQPPEEIEINIEKIIKTTNSLKECEVDKLRKGYIDDAELSSNHEYRSHKFAPPDSYEPKKGIDTFRGRWMRGSKRA